MAFTVQLKDSIIFQKDAIISVQSNEIAYSDSLFIDCTRINQDLQSDLSDQKKKTRRTRFVAFFAGGVAIIEGLLIYLLAK